VTAYELVYFDTCYEEIQPEWWNTYDYKYLINIRKNCYNITTNTLSTLLGCMPLNKVKTELKNSHYIETSSPANISVNLCISKCTELQMNYAILEGAGQFNRKSLI